jgi:hypothetical protein
MLYPFEPSKSGDAVSACSCRRSSLKSWTIDSLTIAEGCDTEKSLRRTNTRQDRIGIFDYTAFAFYHTCEDRQLWGASGLPVFGSETPGTPLN